MSKSKSNKNGLKSGLESKSGLEYYKSALGIGSASSSINKDYILYCTLLRGRATLGEIFAVTKWPSGYKILQMCAVKVEIGLGLVTGLRFSAVKHQQHPAMTTAIDRMLNAEKHTTDFGSDILTWFSSTRSVCTIVAKLGLCGVL